MRTTGTRCRPGGSSHAPEHHSQGEAAGQAAECGSCQDTKAKCEEQTSLGTTQISLSDRTAHAKVGEEGPKGMDSSTAQPKRAVAEKPGEPRRPGVSRVHVIGAAGRSKAGEENGMGSQTEAGPYLPHQRNGHRCIQASQLVTEARIRIMRSRDGRTVRGQGGRLLTTERKTQRGG